MPKEQRLTAGHYGRRDRRLSRDDFAAIVFTLVPPDQSPPRRCELQADLTDHATGHLNSLARVWPEEPIATLAEDVGRHLTDPRGTDPRVVYAAALVCNEEAMRAASTGDEGTYRSARAASLQLKELAGAAGAQVEDAFDE